MSRQLGVGRSRFQPLAAPAIAEPLKDRVAPRAHFTESLGQPRKLSGLKARLTFGLAQRGCMNRAFSAGPVGHQIRGAMPHASTEIAPLALTRAKVTKLARTTRYFLVPQRSVKRANSATDCTFIFAITWARCILTVA